MTRGERVAKRLGEDATRVQTLKGRFVDRLMRSGVIVDLDIGRWRGFTRLKKEDLGLNPEAFEKVRHLIEYGNKRLLPKAIANKLASLDTQARANLGRHGFSTAFGTFVPEHAYREWKTRHGELQGEYFKVRDEIVKRYRTIKREMLAEYAGAAKEAWMVMHQNSERVGRLAFIRSYLARIEAAWPIADAIEESFRFDYTLSFIPLTSAVMKEEKRQAKIEAEARMQEEVRAHYMRRKQELVDRFLADVVGQLRTLVFDVCDDVLGAIKRNGKLVSRSAIQLRNLLGKVEQLNFYGDREITRKLNEVRLTLEAPVKTGNEQMRTARLEALLIDLQDSCRQAKEGLENVDPLVERFLAIEVDDDAEPSPVPLLAHATAQ